MTYKVSSWKMLSYKILRSKYDANIAVVSTNSNILITK